MMPEAPIRRGSVETHIHCTVGVVRDRFCISSRHSRFTPETDERILDERRLIRGIRNRLAEDKRLRQFVEANRQCVRAREELFCGSALSANFYSASAPSLRLR